MKILRFVALCLLVFILAACQQQSTEKQTGEKSAEEPKVKPGEMVLVPAGECIIGSNEKGEDGQPTTAFPERKLNLPAFYIDKYEVTNGEFLKFTAAADYVSEADKEGSPMGWRTYYRPGQEDVPVLNLTWEDARAYAKWAGKRLPTEEEWEKAARGADGRRYPWGNEWSAGKANMAEAGLKQVRPVGSFPGDVSLYGAFDMAGNVQEWTESLYKAYPGSKKKDQYYEKNWRVARGGTVNHKGKMFHLWDRGAYDPKALYSLGVRCAKDAEKADLRLPRDERAAHYARAWVSKMKWTALAFGRPLLPQ
jgi:formylglycine-generating enzyme required for sulfatase activity